MAPQSVTYVGRFMKLIYVTEDLGSLGNGPKN